MKLNVKKREVTGKKVKNLIKNDILPGVVYSRHMKESLSIQFGRMDFIRAYRDAGESTPVILEGATKTMALIHDMHIHPVTNQVLHVDFLAVKADEKVEAEVPLVFVGESIVEKDKIGKIEKIKDHVLVEAFPADLPHNIEVDLSLIKDINDVIFVKDLNVGSKVEITDHLDSPILTVISLEDLGSEEEETTTEVTAESTEKTGE